MKQWQTLAISTSLTMQPASAVVDCSDYHASTAALHQPLARFWPDLHHACQHLEALQQSLFCCSSQRCPPQSCAVCGQSNTGRPVWNCGGWWTRYGTSWHKSTSCWRGGIPARQTGRQLSSLSKDIQERGIPLSQIHKAHTRLSIVSSGSESLSHAAPTAPATVKIHPLSPSQTLLANFHLPMVPSDPA